MILLFIVCLIILLKLFIQPSVDFFQMDEFNTDERKRIRIYLGGLIENNPVHPFQVSKQHSKIYDDLIRIQPGARHYISHPTLERKGNGETGQDIDRIVMHSELLQDFSGWIKIATFADAIDWYNIPTLSKARHMNGKTIQKPYAILMRFRHQTHFGNIPKAQEISKHIPWEKKKNCVIWRGGPSGTGFHNRYEEHLQKPSREVMLQKWASREDIQNEIDVGLVPKWNYQDFSKWIKNKMTLQEMLGYKYILSVEGNDVATNLKWAMSSNSLVLMPVPKVESWFTESRLEPWEHNVPIKDDFSDLLEQKRWCDTHPQECKEIIQNANSFVQPFLNEHRDILIAAHVFEEYIRCVQIIVKD